MLNSYSTVVHDSMPLLIHSPLSETIGPMAIPNLAGVVGLLHVHEHLYLLPTVFKFMVQEFVPILKHISSLQNF